MASSASHGRQHARRGGKDPEERSAEGTRRVPAGFVRSLLGEAELERAGLSGPEPPEDDHGLEPPAPSRGERAEPTEDGFDPEELEARLEEAAEAAESTSFHLEEPVFEALLDEGTPLEEFSDEDGIEAWMEERAEELEEHEREPVLGRAVPPWPPVASAPGESDGDSGEALDVGAVRERLGAEHARLAGLVAAFEDEGLRDRSEQEDLSALSALEQHPADQGTETFDRERDLSVREQVEAELAEVEAALERLAQGHYGLCEACGQPIGTGRLEAVPAARLCLGDQLAREREMFFKRREVEG